MVRADQFGPCAGIPIHAAADDLGPVDLQRTLLHARQAGDRRCRLSALHVACGGAASERLTPDLPEYASLVCLAMPAQSRSTLMYPRIAYFANTRNLWRIVPEAATQIPSCRVERKEWGFASRALPSPGRILPSANVAAHSDGVRLPALVTFPRRRNLIVARFPYPFPRRWRLYVENLSLVVLIVAVIPVLALHQMPGGGPDPDSRRRRRFPSAIAGQETAVFAGGCFWGTQSVFERVKGVLDTTVGYAGGSAETATYDQVTTETTGHAESVRWSSIRRRSPTANCCASSSP